MNQISFKKQLRMGIKTEREHKDILKYVKPKYRKLIYKKIALSHIKENPRYYTKLKRARL